MQMNKYKGKMLIVVIFASLEWILYIFFSFVLTYILFKNFTVNI